MNEDIQREIKKRIDEIEEKSANGDYIYRGEPKRHRKVSSTLYRRHAKEIEAEYFDIEVVQNEMLIEAKRYIHEKDELEILTQLQHYGGKTNLIDFTTDYLIALFFACDGYHDKHGRIIMVKKTEKIKGHIEETQSPINRVRDQKSVFVRPPKGFIEPGQYKRITIPKHLKQPILGHLEKYHGISANTIYNDLHGFIRVQDLHRSAYTEFFKGWTYQNRKEYDKAIEHYTEALNLNPQLVTAYNNRGLNYEAKGYFDYALEDYNRAIELKPDHVTAYLNRGNVYDNKGDYDRAIINFNKVIELSPNLAEGYNNRGNTYKNKGDYDRALDDFSKTIALKPDDANAYLNRGLVHSVKHRYDCAITDFDRAIKLKPDHTIAYAFRAFCRYQRGEFTSVIEDCNYAIELDPQNRRAHDLLDKAQRELEKSNEFS